MCSSFSMSGVAEVGWSRCCRYSTPSVCSSKSCFEKDISKVESEGMVYFTFYNVYIHGKNEKGVGGGKYTKGLVEFEVNSTSDMVDRTAQNAIIEFKGGEEFETNTDD